MSSDSDSDVDDDLGLPPPPDDLSGLSDSISLESEENDTPPSDAGSDSSAANEAAEIAAQIAQLHTEKLAASEAEEYGLAKELKGKIVALEAELESSFAATGLDEVLRSSMKGRNGLKAMLKAAGISKREYKSAMEDPELKAEMHAVAMAASHGELLERGEEGEEEEEEEEEEVEAHASAEEDEPVAAMRRTSHAHLHEPSDSFIFGAVFGDDAEVSATTAVEDETATDWIASAASEVASGGSLSDAAHRASFTQRHGRAPEEGEHEWDSILGIGAAMMVETDEEDEAGAVHREETMAAKAASSEDEPQEEEEDEEEKEEVAGEEGRHDRFDDLAPRRDSRPSAARVMAQLAGRRAVSPRPSPPPSPAMRPRLPSPRGARPVPRGGRGAPPPKPANQLRKRAPSVFHAAAAPLKQGMLKKQSKTVKTWNLNHCMIRVSGVKAEFKYTRANAKKTSSGRAAWKGFNIASVEAVRLSKGRGRGEEYSKTQFSVVLRAPDLGHAETAAILEHRALQRKKSILSLVKKKEKALTGETMLFRGANAADTLEWIAGAFLSIHSTVTTNLLNL